MEYGKNEVDPNVFICTEHQEFRMQEFQMDEEETELMKRTGSTESVNTQSLHNKSVPGLPLSVLHCIQAF